jgi:TrpR family trp operon transcriptional repressor
VNENFLELARVLSKVGEDALMEDFLRCLLTQAEIADIAGRWALIKALQQNVPQREIAKDLSISLCKITRGSREMKKENSAFMRVLRKYKNIIA